MGRRGRGDEGGETRVGRRGRVDEGGETRVGWRVATHLHWPNFRSYENTCNMAINCKLRIIRTFELIPT